MFMADIALNERLIYYVNGSHDDQEVKLPASPLYSGDYEIIANTATGEVFLDDNSILIESKAFALKALSSVILKKKITK